MKSIALLNNIERAKIIFSLFPKEANPFIAFVSATAKQIKEDEDKQRAAWKNGLFTFNSWLAQINAVEQDIEEYQNSKKKTMNCCTILFEGYKAWFTAHCLILYAEQHSNEQFKISVQLFFNS